LTRPRVGVSACLLGQAVRYDGAARPVAWIRDELPRFVEILPFCPESEAGLGVPRPPVHLVKDEGTVRLLGVSSSRLDVTSVLEQWMTEQLPLLRNLDALVFKARSPSCGLNSTPLYDRNGVLLSAQASGIYADWVRKQLPDMLLCDEVGLESRRQQEGFLRQLGIHGFDLSNSGKKQARMK